MCVNFSENAFFLQFCKGRALQGLSVRKRWRTIRCSSPKSVPFYENTEGGREVHVIRFLSVHRCLSFSLYFSSSQICSCLMGYGNSANTSFFQVWILMPIFLPISHTNPSNSFSRVKYKRILQPSEIVDVLKGTIIIICCIILSHVDMAMMYHLIKSQSVIKLYIFYNMLEVKKKKLLV